MINSSLLKQYTLVYKEMQQQIESGTTYAPNEMDRVGIRDCD